MVKIPTGERGHFEISDIQVLTQPRGKNFDDTYGMLGTYALDQLGAYSFDYRTMQFSARSAPEARPSMKAPDLDSSAK
jgi:hypothetical protein